jgi:hypothetical protein
MAATAEFRLSIMQALADQLARGLEALQPEPLDLAHLNLIDRKPGVYQLYNDDELVYIGKTDSSIAKRLREHYEKINCRLNISTRQIKFTALYVDEELNSIAPETRLIDMYREKGLATWNGKGFGPHDPGQQRDQTAFEPDHFDSMYPANLDWICQDIQPGTYSAAVLLKKVKKSVPFLFRYESADFHKSISVEVEEGDPTANELFDILGRAINQVDLKWRITALPGYVIMYQKPGPYLSARKQYPPVPPSLS